MDRIARMLHISDLHFVEELTAEGSSVIPGILRQRARTALQKSHSYYKLVQLSEGLRRQKRDLMLCTGDVTTDGSPQAFVTALEFLTAREIRRHNRLIAYGLEATSDRRVLVPGNHDRFGGKLLPLQRRNAYFEEAIFGGAREYPYSVGYQDPSLVGDDPWTLLFFVFDSTPSPIVKFWAGARIARGHVTTPECDWLVREAERIAFEGRVNGIDGAALRVNRDKCVRIAVLHHHPIVDEEKAETFRYRLEYLENHEAFVDHCFESGMNLVLFGHQHLQYRQKRQPPRGLARTPFGEPTPLYFLCCPSTLQYSEPRNGYYLLDIRSSGFVTELYEWSDVSLRFEINPSESGYTRFN